MGLDYAQAMPQGGTTVSYMHHEDMMLGFIQFTENPCNACSQLRTDARCCAMPYSLDKSECARPGHDTASNCSRNFSLTEKRKHSIMCVCFDCVVLLLSCLIYITHEGC